MLLYVESSAFFIYTFVVQCNQADSLAKVRAKILHILYSMGKENHQFRLRFKGQYLRESYCLEDYRIGDRSILKMVPMAKKGGEKEEKENNSMTEQNRDINIALVKEITKLKRRERILADFKGSMFISTLFILFGFFTKYWYSSLWTGLIAFFGINWCPTYTHKAGFVGTTSMWPRRFMIMYAVLAMLNWGGAITLLILSTITVVRFSCIEDDDPITDLCTLPLVGYIYDIIYYILHTIYLIGIWTAAWSLVRNFNFEIGDYLEKYLIIMRDVEKVILTAKNGRVKEQRTAAYELATLATTGDDSKFRIVAEGGLEVLISLGLSSDEATQEYAVEAIAELLTVPAIQDQFVEAGGVTTLTTLLHSGNTRMVQEAVTAISFIVADSDLNKHAVAGDKGLEDLAHAVKSGSEEVQRRVAGILLDLAFSPEIRAQMAAMNSPIIALITLCTSADPETLRLSLQTLELIAIENADCVLSQDSLVEHLLNVPNMTLDVSIYQLTAKILLYFAENVEACSKLLQYENLKDSLMDFAKTKDGALQQVVCKIILCTLEEKSLASKSKDLGLREVLVYISSNSGDRDAWNLADQGITFLESGNFKFLPPAPSTEVNGSTMSLRKVTAPSMDPEKKEPFGSRASLSKAGPSGVDTGIMGSTSSIQKAKFASEASLSSRASRED